jgi:thiamine pyrophosphokinase
MLNENIRVTFLVLIKIIKIGWSVGGMSYWQNKILALGGVGGRRDQEFANYNVMFTYPHLPMVTPFVPSFFRFRFRNT